METKTGKTAYDRGTLEHELVQQTDKRTGFQRGNNCCSSEVEGVATLPTVLYTTPQVQYNVRLLMNDPEAFLEYLILFRTRGSAACLMQFLPTEGGD